jgi:MFS family permease
VLVASFLFNLGQGVLRPALPLYLERSFAANYRMVTLIPVAFGAGRRVASLPTGYLLDRVGRRPLMIAGLLVMAGVDIASAVVALFGVFLALRTLGGFGWAMFGTVATTVVVSQPSAERRGRTISLLLMSETLGLLFGSTAGGVLYQVVGATSPFVFEAACMVLAAVAVAWQTAPPARPTTSRLAWSDYDLLKALWRVPGVHLIGGASGFVATIPTAVLGDRVSPPLQAIAIGWLRTVGDSGFIVGPLVFGALADATLLSAPFMLGAAILAAIAWCCRSLGGGFRAPVGPPTVGPSHA